jgi:hypothetical protein
MRAHDRRRLVLAATLTVIALPAVWLLEGSDPHDSATEAIADDSNLTLPLDTEPPVPLFLDNTTPVVAPAVIDIAVPEPAGSREARGEATFKRFIGAPVPRPCTTDLAPTNVVITVTNIDNGLSTTCTNTRFVIVPPGADIALDTDVYVIIAELVEAPVPVRLSW